RRRSWSASGSSARSSARPVSRSSTATSSSSSPAEVSAELAGKQVLVVGLARSGRAAAEALAALGARVVGYDRNAELDVGRLRELGVEVHVGPEEETLLQGSELLVKSPGVPGETPLVAGAR